MKKIMFNDKYWLTDAVLRGRKTQTRRMIPKSFFSLTWDTRDDTLVFENDFGDSIDIRHSTFAYSIGEPVAVAQSYRDVDDFYRKAAERNSSWIGQVITMYDCVSKKEIHDWSIRLRKELKDSVAWTNKMFVKADLMPHQIRITNVRVEHLKDICDKDCIKEGIQFDQYDLEYQCEDVFDYSGNGGDAFDTPQEAYADLVDRICGKGTWESNPYVLVYDFELIK